MFRTVYFCIIFSLASSLIITAQAENTNDATTPCSQLTQRDFSNIPDAPTYITASNFTKAEGLVPEYCRVEGYIAPSVGFELRLPSNWNGKFLKVGCGDLCGALMTNQCTLPLIRGYACIASDMGHKGPGALWAKNNLRGKVDWGFRATHQATLAGKFITKQYYQSKPKRSYYLGCSTGGRQGMLEAQYYPHDFDGIVAGAPSLNVAKGILSHIWGRHNIIENDRPLFNAAELQFVRNAAIERCDMDDGVQDGIIGNPSACNFNAFDLVCSNNEKGNNNQQKCLSKKQAAAIQNIYSGPLASDGKPLYSGGLSRGSEHHLKDKLSNSFPGIIENWYRYVLYTTPENYSVLDNGGFDFANEYRRFGGMMPLYSATNPDLREFKAQGGKLIVYHGWNDAVVLPGISTDYYQITEKAMGGKKATQEFFRLFMLPGVDHCTGGEGAFAVDYLKYLETWVETGQAPEVIIGANLKAGPGNLFEQFPLDPRKVAFTRPVYPYPLYAKYKGTGSTDDAANFIPQNP